MLSTIIDKLRRCNEAGAIFYSRCADPRMPAKDVQERSLHAYSLLLSFTKAISESMEESPLGK
jgi:hypothetical protein